MTLPQPQTHLPPSRAHQLSQQTGVLHQRRTSSRFQQRLLVFLTEASGPPLPNCLVARIIRIPCLQRVDGSAPSAMMAAAILQSPLDLRPTPNPSPTLRRRTGDALTRALSTLPIS